MKKKKIRPLLYVLTFIIIIGLGFGMYHFIDETNKQKEKVKVLTEEQNNNSRTAWVSLCDIRAGEKLEQDINIELRQIYTGVDNSLFWQPGSTIDVATVDISALTPVFTTMTANSVPATDAREYEISTVNLMTTQQDYDFVDVRISFPDGSDYIVLAKKQISNLSLNNCVYTVNAREDEIQYMTSAILDAYLIKGTRLYTTRYTESNLQETAVPTYPVKAATLNMLSSATNVNLSETIARATLELNRQARLDLEQRLGIVSEEEAQAASEAWSSIQQSYRDELQAQIDAANAE